MRTGPLTLTLPLPLTLTLTLILTLTLTRCAQGLALARLIFNRDRGEDVAIEALLLKALALREILKDKAKLAETQNSLGSLAQKQANLPRQFRPSPSPNPRLSSAPYPYPTLLLLPPPLSRPTTSARPTTSSSR